MIRTGTSPLGSLGKMIHHFRERTKEVCPRFLQCVRPLLWLRATAWLSRSDLNQPAKCYGTWLVSDQLPWSDTHPDTGSFAVLREYAGVLRRAVHVGPTGPFLKAGFLEIPRLWKSPSIAVFLSASTGVRRGGLVGHPPYSITLWWLVRVRPAPPPSRLQTGEILWA